MTKNGIQTKSRKSDSKGSRHKHHEKGRKVDLGEQILSMGGEKNDVELMKGGVGEGGIVTGEQGADVSNPIHSDSSAEISAAITFEGCF